MAELLRFRLDPVEAGIGALDAAAPIVSDIRMVEVGLQKRSHASPILCMLDHGADLAAAEGITRTSAGLLALGDQLEGAIIVIGNAPSALLALCSLIEKGLRPALVIGTPVGFVNAAESKALLRTLEVPSISNEGTRGGTPVAVAAMNEIITIRAERRA
jgi:precorrin-8X/cobalt-precorrin-8 methylmutase